MKSFSTIYHAIVITLVLHVTGAYAQLSVGTVTGEVHLSTIESDMMVQLKETSSSNFLDETAVLESQFVFRQVPFGTYTISINSEGVLLAQQRIVVNSPIPVMVQFDSSHLFTMKEVSIEAPAGAGATSTHWFHTRSSIDKLPAFTGIKSIESVLLNTPGVVPDEDGRMHVRGEDAQLQYIVDGIPITGNLTRVYSSLFNADRIKATDIQTGGLNAEYGVATAGVISVTSQSGFDAPMFFSANAHLGSFNSRDASVQWGGNLNNRSALYLAGHAGTSDRYLDPITDGEPNHDGGSTEGALGKIDLLASDKIAVNILGEYNHTIFEVPNALHKDPAQDQMQDLTDYLIGGRVNITTGDSSLLSGMLYHRHSSGMFTSGGLMQLVTTADYTKAVQENEDFFIGGDRTYSNNGGQIEFSTRPDWFGRPNALRAGIALEVYPVEEFFTFAVTNPALSDSNEAGGDSRYLPYDITQGGTPFLVDQSKTGHRYSAFIQDEIRFGPWTMNGGIRFDSYKLIDTETAFSPRINVALAAFEDLSLRASYNRVVMQAPLENYLVSSSDEARQLVGAEQGSIPTVVRSEKAHVIELGGNFRVSRIIDLDFSLYTKLISDFIVKVELGSSGVIFPANLKEGLVAGAEVQARLKEWNNFSGALSISTCISRGMTPADGSSPVSAGLILGEEGMNYSHPFGGEDHFPTEHNQILTVVANINYDHPSGFFGVFGGRLDSGLPFDLTGPNGEPLNEEESREELIRRGYSEDVIDLLNLKPEKEGSPDRAVAPHVVFDVSLGYDFESSLSFPLRLTGTVLNVFDTPYLYKFESSFGGTHFGVPRFVSLAIDVRI